MEEKATTEATTNKKEVKFPIKPRSLTYEELKKLNEMKADQLYLAQAIEENNSVLIHEIGYKRADFFINEIYKDPSMKKWDVHILNSFIGRTMDLTFRGEDEETKN